MMKKKKKTSRRQSVSRVLISATVVGAVGCTGPAAPGLRPQTPTPIPTASPTSASSSSNATTHGAAKGQRQ
jgi:hypothetical protein